MGEEMTRGEKINKTVTDLLKAKNTLLWICTREERRVERAVTEAAGAAKYPVLTWDCATGLEDPSMQEGQAQTELLGKVKRLIGSDGSDRDPAAVLAAIRKGQKGLRVLLVMRDLHPWIRDPATLRLLRSTARDLQLRGGEEARAIVVLSPVIEVPLELTSLATVVEYPLPDRVEVERILDRVVDVQVRAMSEEKREDRRSKLLPSPEAREFAIDAAVGLTSEEAENCYAMSIVSTRGRIDPGVVAAEKKRIVAREKVLSWTDPDPRGLDAVGGLGVLKQWLMTRKSAFTKEAREYGILPPKGVMLAGLPGGGKSLTAKCIATAWSMPLIRVDFGALKSKFVGDSEANLRKALQLAEAISPCCLWVDEIEKAFAGASGPQGDGGVSADFFGHFLTWLQEHKTPVFVIVTANDITGLPPEFLRKGRFDEVFWLDLPTKSERAEILRIAVTASGRKPVGIDHGRVADACHDFLGAEVAGIVPDAMFRAFGDGGREITTEDLLLAAGEVTPLAVTAKSKVDALREWAKGKARHASKPEEKRAAGSRVVEYEEPVDPTAN